jgi:hypothetical protein
MGKDERNRRRVEQAWLKREAERRRKAKAAPGEPAPGAKGPPMTQKWPLASREGPGTRR